MKKVSVVLLVLVLVGCGAPVAVKIEPTSVPTPVPTSLPCSLQAAEYVGEVQGIVQEWDDANSLAGSTPRASLATQIAALQEIRRRADAFEHPGCADKPHSYLMAYMTSVIDAYLAFLANEESDTEIQNRFKGAENMLTIWAEEFGKLRDGLEPYDQ